IVSTELLGRSRPEIQWIGASKCVPVCSPHEKLFQYQPGPRASYAETSSIRNGQHWPISGGSAICGNSGESVCVRSTTRMRCDAIAPASSASNEARAAGAVLGRFGATAVVEELMAESSHDRCGERSRRSNEGHAAPPVGFRQDRPFRWET